MRFSKVPVIWFYDACFIQMHICDFVASVNVHLKITWITHAFTVELQYSNYTEILTGAAWICLMNHCVPCHYTCFCLANCVQDDVNV